MVSRSICTKSNKTLSLTEATATGKKLVFKIDSVKGEFVGGVRRQQAHRCVDSAEAIQFPAAWTKVGNAATFVFPHVRPPKSTGDARILGRRLRVAGHFSLRSPTRPASGRRSLLRLPALKQQPAFCGPLRIRA